MLKPSTCNAVDKLGNRPRSRGINLATSLLTIDGNFGALLLDLASGGGSDCSAGVSDHAHTTLGRADGLEGRNLLFAINIASSLGLESRHVHCGHHLDNSMLANVYKRQSEVILSPF